jgi:disulfide bond formation protein DsbB
MTIVRPREESTVPHRIASPFLRLLLMTLLLSSAGLATACGGKDGGGTPAASPETIALGNKQFLGTCATCHGKDANGLPKQGKSLLMNPYSIDKSDDDLALFIKTGRPAGDPLNTTGVDMPPKGGNPALSDDDVKAIVAYLRTLQTLTT